MKPIELRFLIASSIALVVSVTGCTSEVEQTRDAFVSGCKAGGPSASVCRCVYDALKDHYGEDQMILVNQGAALPGLGEQTLLAADRCRDE